MERGLGGGGARAAGKARKIGASTQYDFGGGRVNCLRRALAVGGAVGEAGVVGVGGAVADGEAAAGEPQQWGICAEYGAVVFSGVLALLPCALRARGRDGARSDGGRRSRCRCKARIWRFLDSLEAHNEGQLMKINHGDEPSGVGGGEGEAEADSPGHRQHDEPGVRGSDGGAEGIQPAATGRQGAATVVEFCG